MKTILIMSLLCMTGYAADSVTITKKTLGMNPSVTNAVLTRIDGADFENIRHHVERVVTALGTNTTWWSLGPDATYLSATISLNEKTYTINSWHPIHKDNPKIAVSEKRGLVSASGPQEKTRIENLNSENYKTRVSIFDLLDRDKP